MPCKKKTQHVTTAILKNPLVPDNVGKTAPGSTMAVAPGPS